MDIEKLVKAYKKEKDRSVANRMRLKIPFQLIFGHWHDHICEKFCVLFTNFSFTV